jgi:DNA-binding NtrC family response regulator
MSKKILILNKNIDELSNIRQMFAKEGCEIITASNWDTAVKLFSKIDIDYLVLDVSSKAEKNKFQTLLNEAKI